MSGTRFIRYRIVNDNQIAHSDTGHRRVQERARTFGKLDCWRSWGCVDVLSLRIMRVFGEQRGASTLLNSRW